MTRSLIGGLAGVAFAAALLYATRLVLLWATHPTIHSMDHWVIYLSMVLGAGFGALCGAYTGREPKS